MDKRPENITFYILFPGDTEEDCDREMNQIGIEHYQKKYTDKEKNFFHWQSIFTELEGFRRLKRAMIRGDINTLKNIKIISSKGKKLSIEDLFDRINKSSILR